MEGLLNGMFTRSVPRDGTDDAGGYAVTRMRMTWALAIAALLVVAGNPLGPEPAVQAQEVVVDTSASAQQVAESIAADPSTVTGAAWAERPGGQPTARASGFLAGFPRDGADFGILTSGNAGLADDPNSSGSTGVSNGGQPVRGTTDYDVTVLRIDLEVPTGTNCLVGIQFRFLSDEFPEFVNSSYNDAFVLELDESTWTTSGSTISAPDNFAFDPVGNVISINAAGATSMSAVEADGTTYDGATPVLTAATPIDPGSHTLYLSIFDQGDQIYDSAVFLDDLRFGRVADVANDCRPGAQVVDRQQPMPLLGAHGITGAAEDMVPNLDFAEEVVEDLPDTLSTDTAAVGSVWDNAQTLAEDAFTLADRNDSGAVNIIAHSKGGLDSRVAMWAVPNWFEDLAMLATPNGGSGLANTLCFLRRVGIDGVFGEMGPCDSDADGLYNLQTAYIADVYNEIVKDSPQHDFWVAAGDCMGAAWTDEGRIDCNGTSLVGHDCTDVDGWGGLGDPDGENAVCVWSAFAQVAGFDPGGRHFAIDPVFQGLNHTDVRQDACPNTAVLAWMYGSFYPDNPWIQGDEQACEDFPRLDGSYDPTALMPIPSSSLQATAAAGNATAGQADAPSLQLQRVQAIHLSDDGVGTLPVTDEGDGLGVFVLADEGDLEDVRVHDAAGQPIAAEVSHDVAVFGVPGARALLYPTVGDATLTLTGRPGAQMAVSTTVVSAVQASVAAQVLSPDEVELVVTMRHASPSTARPSVVEALVGSGPDRTPIDVALDKVNGAELTYRTTITPERGSHQPVDIFVSGPHERIATTGFIVEDGTGSIDRLVADALVDTDGDGRDDALQLTIAVSTDVAGPHQLSLQLTIDDTVVGTGPGQADLVAGTNTMDVTIGLDEMASVGLAGPWEVTDLVLTRGPERTWIARADSLGLTSPVAREVLGAGGLEISRPIGNGSDADLDGLLDTLTWSWTTWVPEAGTYEFEGIFLGPRGQQLSSLTLVTDLVEGPNDLSETLDGALVGGHLAGRYSLVDLTVTSGEDPTSFDRAPAGFTDFLDPAQWTAGTPDMDTLIALWRTGHDADQIFTQGLYQSELNRLLRAQDALAAGDVDGAVGELATFRKHVEVRENKLDPELRSQLLGYSSELIDTLGG